LIKSKKETFSDYWNNYKKISIKAIKRKIQRAKQIQEDLSEKPSPS